jgi:hypothetical protein
MFGDSFVPYSVQICVFVFIFLLAGSIPLFSLIHRIKIREHYNKILFRYHVFNFCLSVWERLGLIAWGFLKALLPFGWFSLAKYFST